MDRALYQYVVEACIILELLRRAGRVVLGMSPLEAADARLIGRDLGVRVSQSSAVLDILVKLQR